MINRCLLAVWIPLAGFAAQGASPTPCESLAALTLPQAAITSAQSEAAGAFSPPQADAHEADLYRRLPPFCRVVVQSKPTADSSIQIEIWMPASNWNGKYQGQGNGGFAGSISYQGMAGALASGYATAGTDTGHQGEGTDADWALRHPEKIIDFGYRGIHEMTGKAKAIIQAFYGDAPRRSYFSACSDGGREALMEAQRFPEDYDGILAGAPANYWSHLLASGASFGKQINTPGSFIPDTKIPIIAAAVLAACDARDNVKDGILNDPRKCRFSPSTLLCGSTESVGCLSAPQVKLLKRIYAGGVTSTGQQIFPGYLPGAEEGEGGWKTWILGTAPGKSTGGAFVSSYFRNMVFDNPQWTVQSTTVDDDVRMADEKTAMMLNATDPDLSAFQKRGGKLIMYHGWNDPAISALNSIQYYGTVIAKMGQPAADKLIRLYMVPGMQHCIGGPGPSYFGQFSMLPSKDPGQSIYTQLEQWVENDVAPREVVASKYPNGNSAKPAEMTRPICPYPQTARYKGSGDTKEAGNFMCANE